MRPPRGKPPGGGKGAPPKAAPPKSNAKGAQKEEKGKAPAASSNANVP